MVPDPKTSHGNCRNRDCRWICQTDGSDQSMRWQVNPSSYRILWVIQKCANKLFTLQHMLGGQVTAVSGCTNRRMLHICQAPPRPPHCLEQWWVNTKEHSRQNCTSEMFQEQRAVSTNKFQFACPSYLQVNYTLEHLAPGGLWYFTIWPLLPLLSLTFPYVFSSKIQSSPGNRKHWPFSQRNIQAKEEMSSSHRPIENQDCSLLKSHWVPFLEKQLFSSWFWVPALWLFGCLCHVFPQEIAMFLIPVVWHVHVPAQWHTLI